MNITKYEYKMHKFIKLLFHAIFFIAGFILGYTLDKVDAYTLYSDSNGTIDEEFIINEFNNHFSDFNINDYVFAIQKLTNTWKVYAIFKDNIYLAEQNTSGALGFGAVNCYNLTGKHCYHQFTLRKEQGAYNFNTVDSGGVTITYSNFDSLSQYNSDFTYDYSSKNVLDFSSFSEDNSVHYDYDDSIFLNPGNTDFNKYCFDYEKELLFSIIPKSSMFDGFEFNNENHGEREILDIFFVYGDIGNLSRGEKVYSWAPGISSDNDFNPLIKLQGIKFDDLDNIKNPSDDYFTYLNSINKIDSNISFDNDYYFNNRSKLLWSYKVPFRYYTNAMNDYTYDIFRYRPRIHEESIDSTTVYYQNENITYTGEVPLPLTGNFCFYVRNTYNVYTYTTNELGGLKGEVILPDGRVDVSTDNLDNSIDNSNSLFDRVIDFISSIKQTLNFISDNILELFNSMPVLLRSFIITTLVLIIIKLIISMITR